jgi:hypothetical protein
MQFRQSFFRRFIKSAEFPNQAEVVQQHVGPEEVAKSAVSPSIMTDQANISTERNHARIR